MNSLLWLVASVLGCIGLFFADAHWLCNVMIITVLLIWSMLCVAHDENHHREYFSLFCAFLFQVMFCFLIPLLGDGISIFAESVLLITSAAVFVRWWKKQTDRSMLEILFCDDGSHTLVRILFFGGMCGLINLFADILNGVWVFGFSVLFWAFVLLNCYKQHWKVEIVFIILMVTGGMKFLLPISGIELSLAAAVQCLGCILFSLICFRRRQYILLNINSLLIALHGLWLILFTTGNFGTFAIILTCAAFLSYLLFVLITGEYFFTISFLSLVYSILLWLFPGIVSWVVWGILAIAIIAIVLKHFWFSEKTVAEDFSKVISWREPEAIGVQPGDEIIVVDSKPVVGYDWNETCSDETRGKLTRIAIEIEKLIKGKSRIPIDEEITLGQLCFDRRVHLSHEQKRLLQRFVGLRNRANHIVSKPLTERRGREAIELGETFIRIFNR